MHFLRRLNSSLSPAAMIMAILALVVAAAGAGYSAATIGTSDIKNNAVTSAKVKNGTLKAADMVAEKKFKYVDAGGPPNFSNGGQGDCIWQSLHPLLSGLPRVGYRTDRFGTVHLSGLARADNGPGGDATCDTLEQEDGIVFTLPPKARPKKHVLLLQPTGATDATLLIVGKGGAFGAGVALPAGTVYWSEPTDTLILDGISFPASTSKVFGRTAPSGRITPKGAALLKGLGIG